MGFFGKLLKATIETVTLPIDVAKDVISMGGVIDDQDQPYTVQRLKKIKGDLEDAADEL